MKIICAGLNKTGTKSVARALRILGYEVWDFDEQILYYMDEWLELFQHGRPLDFYSMFKDVDAVVDFPSSFFFEELMEAFPDAKVVLSEREEDSWASSYKNMIGIVEHSHFTKLRLLFPTYNKFLTILRNFRMAAMGIIQPNSSYIYRKRYRWHNDRVKSVVPKEKLLVYNLNQGWKPLCAFTGKEIPHQPFPHLNAKGSIFQSFQTETELGRRIAREVNVAVVCSIVLVVVAGLFVVNICARF